MFYGIVQIIVFLSYIMYMFTSPTWLLDFFENVVKAMTSLSGKMYIGDNIQ